VAAHNVLADCDRALAAYLISAGAGTSADVFPAKHSEDKPLPCTICFSSRAKMQSPYLGNYIVSAAIMVKTDPNVDVNQDPDEPPGISDERVADTFDAFFVGQNVQDSSALADAITAAARAAGALTFTVQSVGIAGVEAGFDQKGNAWIDTLDLEILCCPGNVS
jgi:hypothetical protein